MSKFMNGVGKFLETIAPAVPIVGGIAQNVLEGMNTRKARLYNSPKEQVGRLNEAGLPLAAASTLSAGGGIRTGTTALGTENYSGNLQASIQRQISRKQKEIMQQELIHKTADAQVAAGNAANLLNPKGQYTNTNQGTSVMQGIKQQAEAIKNQEIVNAYLPKEKALAMFKTGKEVDMIAQQIKNAAAQENILVSEGRIKNVLANYQESMSRGELQNLIKRNVGLDLANQGTGIQNKIRKIEFDVAYATQYARITEALNNAIASDQRVAANALNNMLLSMDYNSAKTWYDMKTRYDKDFSSLTANPIKQLSQLTYLKMFNPRNGNVTQGDMGLGYGIGQLLKSTF